MEPITLGLMAGSTLMNLLGQSHARRAEQRRHDNYNRAIVQQGLDRPINYRWGNSYNLARQMTHGSRLGASANLNNTIARNNRRAVQSGLGIGDTAELNSSLSNQTYNAGAQNLAQTTYGVAQQNYQQDVANRDRQLNYLKHQFYGGPAQANPWNTVGQIGQGLSNIYTTGANQFYNRQDSQNMLDFLRHDKAGTLDEWTPDTSSFGSHLMGRIRDLFSSNRNVPTGWSGNNIFLSNPNLMAGGAYYG